MHLSLENRDRNSTPQYGANHLPAIRTDVPAGASSSDRAFTLGTSSPTCARSLREGPELQCPQRVNSAQPEYMPVAGN
jgi:hypothetical protein